MIVFLNKKDLFQQKIKTHDIKDIFDKHIEILNEKYDASEFLDRFSPYKGGCDYNAATKYIADYFCKLNRNTDAKKTVYPHLTCATDTKQMTEIFNDVRDVVLRHMLIDHNIL